MPILNETEFQCDFCKGVFDLIRDETWNKEKIEAEYKLLFPNSSMENREIICDDCWEKVRPDRN